MTPTLINIFLIVSSFNARGENDKNSAKGIINFVGGILLMLGLKYQLEDEPQIIIIKFDQVNIIQNICRKRKKLTAIFFHVFRGLSQKQPFKF